MDANTESSQNPIVASMVAQIPGTVRELDGWIDGPRPASREERLAYYEKLIGTANDLHALSNCALVIQGLALLRIETEELYTIHTVEEGGMSRPATLQEYLVTVIDFGCGCSPASLSRARRTAIVYRHLREMGIQIPASLRTAHLLPLARKKIRLEDTPTYFAKAVEMAGEDEMTATHVDEAIALLSPELQPQVSRNTLAKLKQEIRIGLNRIESALEADDKVAFRSELLKMRAVVGENPLRKRARKNAAAKRRNKGNFSAGTNAPPETVAKFDGGMLWREGSNIRVKFDGPLEAARGARKDRLREAGFHYVGNRNWWQKSAATEIQAEGDLAETGKLLKSGSVS